MGQTPGAPSPVAGGGWRGSSCHLPWEQPCHRVPACRAMSDPGPGTCRRKLSICSRGDRGEVLAGTLYHFSEARVCKLLWPQPSQLRGRRQGQTRGFCLMAGRARQASVEVTLHFEEELKPWTFRIGTVLLCRHCVGHTWPPSRDECPWRGLEGVRDRRTPAPVGWGCAVAGTRGPSSLTH